MKYHVAHIRVEPKPTPTNRYAVDLESLPAAIYDAEVAAGIEGRLVSVAPAGSAYPSTVYLATWELA